MLQNWLISMVIIGLVILVVIAAVMIIIVNKKEVDKLDDDVITKEVTLVDKIKRGDKYYLKFTPNIRDVIELEVIEDIYHNFYLGCEGILSYKDNKYIDFVKTK